MMAPATSPKINKLILFDIAAIHSGLRVVVPLSLNGTNFMLAPPLFLSPRGEQAPGHRPQTRLLPSLSGKQKGSDAVAALFSLSEVKMDAIQSCQPRQSCTARPQSPCCRRLPSRPTAPGPSSVGHAVAERQYSHTARRAGPTFGIVGALAFAPGPGDQGLPAGFAHLLLVLVQQFLRHLLPQCCSKASHKLISPRKPHFSGFSAKSSCIW